MGSLTTFKISIICFLDLFAASLIVPLMSNYLKTEIQLSNFTIGLLSSTFALLQILSAPTIGYYSDTYGRRSILLICLGICIISYLCLGLFKSFFVILILRIVLGIFKHTQVICKAFISDLTQGIDSTNAYSQLMTITFLGFFIGPAIGGHIIDYENGFMYICCTASILYIINFIYSYYVVEDVVHIKNNDNKTRDDDNDAMIELLNETSDECVVNNENIKTIKKSIDSDNTTIINRSIHKKTTKQNDNLTNKVHQANHTNTSNKLLSYIKEILNIEWHIYWDIFLLKFIFAISMSLFYSNYVSVLKYNFNIDSKYTGYTVSFQGFIGTFSNIFIKLNNNNNYNNLYYCFIILTISILFLYLINYFLLFIIILIPLSISCSIIRVLTINITMYKGSINNRNGNISGIYNSITSIAKVITPLLSGFIIDYFNNNYKITFFIAFLFSFSGVVLSKYICLNNEDLKNKKE